MTIVVNCAFGGFQLPAHLAEQFECRAYAPASSVRTSPVLIEWVKANPTSTKLRAVEIPEPATDWEIAEYDGYEHIIAVIDGKIKHIHAEW